MIVSIRAAACACIAITLVGLLHAAEYIPPPGWYSLSVADFGATGDGITDDTAAIQSAVNQLQSHGGGILRVPAGTYLLNSFQPSAHPWYFYNLLIGSNVLIQGDTGAKFLQGPRGRSPVVAGASEVRNSVLAFGTKAYTVATFQNPAYNGGFLPLQPAIANTSTVTLLTPSQASHFAVGNYVVVYSATTGDVIPSEPSQINSVNLGTGTLYLTKPLARSFSTPFIANVTTRATYNCGLRNLTVQGSEPLAVTEVFNFSAEDSQFIIDTTVTGSQAYGINLNTLTDFSFSRNLFSSVGPFYSAIELPQRNSQNGLLDSNTFYTTSAGFGEYGAHWTFTGNHFWLNADSSTMAMLFMGGLDVTFTGNDVHGAGNVPVVADYLPPALYGNYVGRISMTKNTITCQVQNSNCVALQSVDPVFANNTLSISGYAAGIKIEGPSQQTAAIQNNFLSGAAMGIMVNTLHNDSVVITGNTIIGPGIAGIFIASPSTPNTGGHTITNNTIIGYNRTVDWDPAKHPGTIVQ